MFGDVLKKLRSEKKLNMDQFVKEINNKYNTSFSKSMVSRWENGLTDPKMESVRIIADFFNVTLDFLLNSEDDSDNNEENNENNLKDDLYQFEEFINNPEHGLFFRDYLEAPEERKRELMQFWRFIQEKEKDRKPGDRQGE